MYRFLILALVVCGLAVTSAQARPRVVATHMNGVSPEAMVLLQEKGLVSLAGIHVLKMGDAGDFLRTQEGPVEYKEVGTDRYGRSQIWLYKPGSDTTMQEALLTRGDALIYDMAATPAAWIQAEKLAQQQKRGLWAEKGWIIDADSAFDALGKFRLVKGTVTRTYKGRDTYWINFGQDWKTDFSIAIPKRAWRSFGDRLEVAPGSTITARGVIELDNGPMLTISRPEQMQIDE